jgi:hypothetical protein
MKQRAEALIQKKPILSGLLHESHELLSEPKMEVLQKRFLVNREEPICRRGVLTTLLAIIMALELKSDLDDIVALQKFLATLVTVIKLSKQYNADELETMILDLKSIKKLQDMRQFLEYMKYGHSGIDGHKASMLIKAGACISGTCA